MPRYLLPLLLTSVLLLTARALADGTPIAPAALGPTLDTVGPQGTAFAADRFLTVWIQSGEGKHYLYGSLRDAGGRLISPRPFIITSGVDFYYFVLIGAGDEFVLIDTATSRIRLTTIDRDGTLKSSRIVGGSLGHNVFRAAWNGQHFGVATARTDGLNFLVIDDDATLLREVPLGRAVFSGLDVIPRGNGFVAVVGHTNGPFGMRIFPNAPPAMTLFDSWAGVESGATSVDQGTAVFWLRRGAAAGMERRIFTTVLRDDGTISPITWFDIDTAAYVSKLQPVATSSGVDLFVLTAEGLGVIDVDADPAPVRSLTTVLPRGWILAASGDTIIASAGVDQQIRTAVIRDKVAGPHELLSLSPARQVDPLLAPVGHAVVAAWTEVSGGGRTTKATTLDAEGVRVTPVTTIRGDALALASGVVDAILLTRDSREIVATQLGADGGILRQDIIGEASDTATVEAAAVWAGTHYVLAWFENTTMKSVLWMPGGTPSIQRTQSLPPPHHRLTGAVWYTRFALAFDGDRLVLAYLQTPTPPYPGSPPGPAIAVAVPLDVFGGLAEEESTLIDDAFPQRLSLASSGDEIVAVTSNLDRAVHALTIPRREPLRVEKRAQLFEAAEDPRAAIAWTGRDYAVAIAHTGRPSHLAVKFIDRELRPTRPSTTAEAAVNGLPVLAATFSGEPVVALSEFQQTAASVASTYIPRVMRELGPPPAPPAGAIVTRDSSSSLAVSWTAPESGAWDGFVVEVRFENAPAPFFRGVYGREARHAIVVAPHGTSVSVRTFNEAGLSSAAKARPTRGRLVAR